MNNKKIEKQLLSVHEITAYLSHLLHQIIYYLRCSGSKICIAKYTIRRPRSVGALPLII